MKKRRKSYREGVGVLLGVLLMSGCLALGSGQTKAHTQSEQISLIEQALSRAIVQCYALEGVYPPSVDYITEHYGVKIDEKRYIVHYEIFASNVMPEVRVIPKQWGNAHE